MSKLSSQRNIHPTTKIYKYLFYEDVYIHRWLLAKYMKDVYIRLWLLNSRYCWLLAWKYFGRTRRSKRTYIYVFGCWSANRAGAGRAHEGRMYTSLAVGKKSLGTHYNLIIALFVVKLNNRTRGQFERNLLLGFVFVLISYVHVHGAVDVP